MSRCEPMRVAYVVKRYPRYSETFIVNEILAHEEAGWDIEVFSLRPPCDTHFQDGIARVRAPVTYVESSGIKSVHFWAAIREAAQALPNLWADLEMAGDEDYRDVYQAVTLAREARQRGINHFHAHFASLPTTVARLAAHFAGLTYTFTAHAKDIFHESANPDDLRRKLADAASVITVSDFNRKFLQEQFGAATSRVDRVYNGLSLERFPYKPPTDRRARIVAVGRLVEKKGFGDLIDACAVLAQEKVSFDCQIIGTGELEADLQTQIDSLSLGDQVHLLGPRPQAEVIQLVQNAAVFAAPCVVGEDGNRDGLPTVLLEAMALGTPCVSTDVTGIPEVIRHEETGLRVPQHDPGQLASAIKRLLTESSLRVRLSNSARQLIESDFDVKRNTVQVRAAFERATQVEQTSAHEVCV